MAFVQGPEIWLNQLGVSVPCVVKTDRPAMLDEAHRVFINYETYYLADAEALATFRAAPWRFTGKVTDPVSNVRFEPDGDSPRRTHKGRLFYFATAEHAETFAREPGAYATPVVPYAGRM
ncbi:hypothetical protein KDK88_07915 [bacterium]|nr:hypothetical protein [bacterium]